MNPKKTYLVKNRSASLVVVTIPNLGYRRELSPGETTKMTYEELEKLSYQAGGKVLMSQFLQIMEDEVTDELGIHKEAEYYMNEQQIVDLLKNGSNEQFMDCLDFAPIGVIDLVKKFAIELPLTDTVKIRILREKTGFDVEAALKHIEEEKAPETTSEANTSTEPTGRRTAANYKVVKKD